MTLVLCALVQGIDWKADWEAAVKEASARNAPIFFTLHTEGYTNLMADRCFADAGVVALSGSFVNVLAHEETKHGEKDGKCAVYKTIPCSTHAKPHRATMKFWASPIRTPATVFCDPQGKELFKADGALTPKDLAKKMQAALAQVPGDKVPLASWQKARAHLADGDAALGKGEIRKALDAYRKVAAIRGLAKLAEDPLARVNEIGETRLADAAGLPRTERRKALAKIVEDFKGLEAAGKAKTELEALK